MSFRYRRRCKTASDTVDTVKLEVPRGFKFLKFKMTEYLKNIVNLNPFKNLKRSAWVEINATVYSCQRLALFKDKWDEYHRKFESI